MITRMVNYNLVKRKIRFRAQKANFLRVSERLFPQSKVHLVTLPELAVFGVLLASPEEQGAGPVTALSHVLMLSTHSPDPGPSVHLWRKGLHKQEGAFWRRESQGVKYSPSYAVLPSWSKGPSRKPEVGSSSPDLVLIQCSPSQQNF